MIHHNAQLVLPSFTLIHRDRYTTDSPFIF
jgi:hypothetical protein